MTYTQAEAEDQAAALASAAADSPVTPVKYSLGAQANEWHRAGKDLGDAGDDEALITTVGAVVPGMFVWYPQTEDSFQRVARCLGSRDGQASMQIDVEGRPVFLNFLGQSSPVVVRA